MEAINKEYLGDGVYAAFDGYNVWLTTPRQNGTHEIALEPEVLDKLLRYVRQWRPDFGKDPK